MSADEFDVIRRLFAPLATDPAARGLNDDVAVLANAGDVVVTTDAIVEGVHFLPDDPMDQVAKKALRVNLSDLAAKGAKPFGFVLSLMWPAHRPAAQLDLFAEGLAEDLQSYADHRQENIALLGGDTTATPGPLAISVTAFGHPYLGRTPSRADARPGEDVWVTGEIGDAYLGLQSLVDPAAIAAWLPADDTPILARLAYWVPEPPVTFAATIARYARASTDVSDGLIADAGNIAHASGVALDLDAASTPLSRLGKLYIARHGADGLARLVTAGDDYQALFTAAPSDREAIQAAAIAAEVEATRIGRVCAGSGVRFLGEGGADIALPSAGHSHRLGK